ncbi:hypothetical protein D3C87_1597440 [compost metagenome]
MARRAAGGEIGRRGDRDQAPVRPDPDGYHILLDALAQTNAGVEAFLDDVAERAVEDQLDGDVGVVLQGGLKLRPDDAVQGVIR